MTTPITGARVRELSSKASKGVWYRSGAAFFTNHHAEDPGLGECFGRSSDDAALIAALCSEPSRDRIAKALDLLERVEAGDAGLVEDVAKTIHDTDDMADTVWPDGEDDSGYRGGSAYVRLCRNPEAFRNAARAVLAALVGEEVK